jgi:radical SAM superfamily enzyme YgiQ (UPF0313 family)
MGHQPLALASPAAFLRRAGFRPGCLDLSLVAKDEEDDEARRRVLRKARLVAISVPMHTALRLGTQLAAEVRRENPNAHIVFYGLYAPLHAAYLATCGDTILGGEFEEPLVDLCHALEGGRPLLVPPLRIKRQAYVPPDRDGLPPLERYAKLLVDGEERIVGSVEATRGCRHLCRHCALPAVYHGHFFAVPQEVVLADARAQVARGAQHLSFRDADFLNAPKHALAVLQAIHAENPELTFDLTAKVEHLLGHRALLPTLRTLGCVFLVSAFESLSDRVLAILDKGHTREDAVLALSLVRAAGISLRPSFVAFTPWTTCDDYVDLCHFVFEHELLDEVDPVQLSLRLLVPPGSLLLAHPEMQRHLGALDEAALTYLWTHPEPRMDRLCAEVSTRVEKAAVGKAEPSDTFVELHDHAARAAGRTVGTSASPCAPQRRRPAPPRLSEPWFC